VFVPRSSPSAQVIVPRVLNPNSPVFVPGAVGSVSMVDFSLGAPALAESRDSPVPSPPYDDEPFFSDWDPVVDDPPEAPQLEPQLLSIVRQVEFYFSDSNLAGDRFMRGQIDANEGWVEIAVIAAFKRMKSLTSDMSLIVCALRQSRVLQVRGSCVRVLASQRCPQVNEDGTKVRRIAPISNRDEKAVARCSVHVVRWRLRSALFHLLQRARSTTWAPLSPSTRCMRPSVPTDRWVTRACAEHAPTCPAPAGGDRADLTQEVRRSGGVRDRGSRAARRCRIQPQH
jgi:hypothetical protein